MGQNVAKIHIRKEALKFSAAHMTVFPDGSKESLHGHNYATEVVFEVNADASLKDMIPFFDLKVSIHNICRLWDERVLLARNCPFFEIRNESDKEIEFILCKKRYILPREEVVLLNLDNITSENLAAEFCRLLIESCRSLIQSNKILSIQVKIDESFGQGTSYTWSQINK